MQIQTSPPKRKLTEFRAADLMRTGSALVRMHTRDGTAWFLVPGGEVSEKMARALIQRPDVQPMSDGLFPGISQTYRLGRHA
jgi:hypothetical protein